MKRLQLGSAAAVMGLLLCLQGGSAAAASDAQQSTFAPVQTQDAAQAFNLEAVQIYYRALAQDNPTAVAILIHPEVVWIEAEGSPYAEGNPYTGVGAVFDGVFAPIMEAFDDYAAIPETYLPSGDRVVVLGRHRGRHKITGQMLDAQFVHIFTFADKRISRFHQYTDTARWMEVVTPH